MSQRNITLSIVFGFIIVASVIAFIYYNRKKKVEEVYQNNKNWIQSQANKAIRAYKAGDSMSNYKTGVYYLLRYYTSTESKANNMSLPNWLRAQAIWYVVRDDKVKFPKWLTKNITADLDKFNIDSHQKDDDFIKALSTAYKVYSDAVDFEVKEEYKSIV